jgi:hypothetical protein
MIAPDERKRDELEIQVPGSAEEIQAVEREIQPLGEK